MGLRFDAPSGPAVPVYPGNQLGSNIESIFNMYQQAKKQAIDSKTAGLQQQQAQQSIDQGNRTAMMGNIQDTAQFGQPLSQITPDQIQGANAAAQPGFQGTTQPNVAHLANALKEFRAQKEAQMQQAGLQAKETQAGIGEKSASAREKNALASLLEKGGSLEPQVIEKGGIRYLETTNMKGEKSYSPLPERIPAQSEHAARGFADKATQADAVLNKLESSGYNPGAIGTAFQGILPNVAKSADQQVLEQSKREFINAILRRESGAAISASEYDTYGRQYFPYPGDSKEVRDNKAQSRALAIRNLSAEGGRVKSQITNPLSDVQIRTLKDGTQVKVRSNGNGGWVEVP